jgi:hypothetical protein
MKNPFGALIVLVSLYVCLSDITYSQIQVTGQNEPVVQYKDRLGLLIGFGSGSQSIPIATLTDGSKTSISFGGGTIVQLEYGHEFNKNFDVAIDIGGQFSSLDQKVSNGSMDFNRTVLSLTPFYVLPITSDDKYRLKLGAGIDFLYNADLNFDLSQVSSGMKDDWKYKSAFGEHVSVLVEMNLPSRFSFSAGAKWQNASYSFDSGNNSYPAANSDLKSPNGSGIVILLGGYYHFDWID